MIDINKLGNGVKTIEMRAKVCMDCSHQTVCKYKQAALALEGMVTAVNEEINKREEGKSAFGTVILCGFVNRSNPTDSWKEGMRGRQRG